MLFVNPLTHELNIELADGQILGEQDINREIVKRFHVRDHR